MALGAWLSPSAAIDEKPLPPFTQTQGDRWINSDPLTVEALRGAPTLVHFWAFECWNCYRSFPWLNEVRGRFADRGVRFIGVHTPEFDREKVREAVIAKAREFDLTHPIMLDNDYAYWRALDNRFWPAYYLVDGEGRVRYRFVGETHAGDPQAKKIEAALETLLAAG